MAHARWRKRAGASALAPLAAHHLHRRHCSSPYTRVLLPPPHACLTCTSLSHPPLITHPLSTNRMKWDNNPKGTCSSAWMPLGPEGRLIHPPGGMWMVPKLDPGAAEGSNLTSPRQSPSPHDPHSKKRGRPSGSTSGVKGSTSKSPLAPPPTPGSATELSCDGTLRGWILAALLEARDSAREAAGGEPVPLWSSCLETVRGDSGDGIPKLPHAPCPMLLAPCSMLHAPCSLFLAPCSLLRNLLLPARQPVAMHAAARPSPLPHL